MKMLGAIVSVTLYITHVYTLVALFSWVGGLRCTGCFKSRPGQYVHLFASRIIGWATIHNVHLKYSVAFVPIYSILGFRDA